MHTNNYMGKVSSHDLDLRDFNTNSQSYLEFVSVRAHLTYVMEKIKIIYQSNTQGWHSQRKVWIP